MKNFKRKLAYFHAGAERLMKIAKDYSSFTFKESAANYIEFLREYEGKNDVEIYYELCTTVWNDIVTSRKEDDK